MEALKPSEPTYDKPAAEYEIDTKKLGDNYEIGFGFYYRYMFRLPGRVELSLAREKWLGIAGLSENGDYGDFSKPGDRSLTVF